jgi:hypothetical protein
VRSRSRLHSCSRWIVAADLILLGYQQLPLAFSIRPEARFFPGPPTATIVNVADGLVHPCALCGYGVIKGYQPMLSYPRDPPTRRKGREDSNYRGETWTAPGPVQPVYWSPNRLVFRVAPGQEVFVNQNPGSRWWSDGRPAFPGLRCAEPMVPFAARADSNGQIELEIRPPGVPTGIALHIVGCALLGAALSLTRRPS